MAQHPTLPPPRRGQAFLEALLPTAGAFVAARRGAPPELGAQVGGLVSRGIFPETVAERRERAVQGLRAQKQAQELTKVMVLKLGHP